MKRIHLIMPMGGGGTRFGRRFDLPKPLIELQDKPFFFWAAQSVMKYIETQDITFVVLREHVERYGIQDCILKYYPDAKIRIIPHVLNGAVLTCLEGVEGIEDDCPILFNDCDHAFICDSFRDFCEAGRFEDVDGGLLTFQSSEPCYSYVRFDAEGQVSGTVEKEVASREAICGAYYFRNRQVFAGSTERYLKHCSYREFFVSGVYNEMLKTGGRVKTFPLETHLSFGSPEEYETVKSDERLEALFL